MLIDTFGRLYYLAGLSWLLALALLAAGPAAAYVLYVRDGPPLLPAASLPLVDHALAFATAADGIDAVIDTLGDEEAPDVIAAALGCTYVGWSWRGLLPSRRTKYPYWKKPN